MIHEHAVKIQEAYNDNFLIVHYHCDDIRVVFLVDQDEETSKIYILLCGDSKAHFIEDEEEDFELNDFRFFKKVDL